MALTAPPGWTETLLPDGAVRLERTRNGRGKTVLLPLILAGALLISTLGSFLDGRPGRGLLPPDAELVLGISAGVVLACMSAIVAVLLAWIWAGEERWIIRNGLLEIRRECLWWKWSRGYSATEVVLELDSAWAPRRNRAWRLLARGRGGDQVITTSAFYGMSELFTLGAYLAARTGWRWHPPQDLSLLTLFGPRGW